MRNFLFATDFDDNAAEMLRYTAMLADKFDSRITMFTAIGTGQLLSKSELHELSATAIKKLKVLVNTAIQNEYPKLDFSYIVDDHYPYDAIPEVAKDEQIDVVVLGMKKGSHSLMALLGNTTLDVLLSIDCGVLVIPEQFSTPDINDLACTTDFKFTDIALLNVLRDMGKKMKEGVSIHCLHVFENDEEEDRVKKDMEILYGVFAGRKGTPIYFEIRSGELTPVVTAFTLEKNIDLLVMNSHQRSPIGKMLGRSETKEVAKGMQVPLLILKDL